jgi:menaquinone-dependent protoporphyrinogen oxidase
VKTLIAFATKHGTTKKCAQILAEKMSGAVLADLKTEKPDPAEYECVIIGGSIYMGRLRKEARKYIAKYKEQLKKKKLGLFICSGSVENLNQYLQTNIDKDIIDCAQAKIAFGGLFDISVMKGMDKMIAQAAVNDAVAKNTPMPCILTENIEKMAEAMK